MAFVNPFGNPQQASSGGSTAKTTGFVNPFANYTPPPQTKAPPSSASQFPAGSIVTADQLRQDFSKPQTITDFISQAGNFIKTNFLDNPILKDVKTKVSNYIDNSDNNVLKDIKKDLQGKADNTVFKGPTGEYKYTGNTVKDTANVILNVLGGLDPIAGGETANIIQGFSKTKGLISAAIQAGVQVAAGQSAEDVLKNIPFGLAGGLKFREELIPKITKIKEDAANQAKAELPKIFTPKEIQTEVVDSNLAKTPLGKQLLKTSFEAQQTGNNIQVLHDPESSLKTPIGVPVKVEIFNPKEPTTVEVGGNQLPVGTGKERLSRLEARITDSLDKTPQEIKDQLGSTYNQMNKKENISRAAEFVTKNPDEALSILKGEKEPPEGILKNSIYVAMENAAHEDAPLARKLASLQSTRAGQELSILTEIDPHSPVKLMSDVVKIREKAVQEKFGKNVSQVTKDTIKEIRDTVQKPSKNDWASFIKEIQC